MSRNAWGTQSAPGPFLRSPSLTLSAMDPTHMIYHCSNGTPEILFPLRGTGASLFFQECVGPGDGRASNVLGPGLLWSVKCFEIGSRWPPPPSQAWDIKKKKRNEKEEECREMCFRFCGALTAKPVQDVCPRSAPVTMNFL